MLNLVVSLSLLVVLLFGCSKQETNAPVTKTVEKKTELEVIVPEKVKADWSAVKIKVTDKENNSSAVYTVSVGGSFVVPGSGLKVEIKNFLPNFIMSGNRITSRGLETENPATQVVISDNEQQLFSGWLFEKNPKSHNFVHPRYNLTLNGFVATRRSAPEAAKKG
ncbi:DUF2155 domain-containing protein [Geopsychrobacter electrodiphilus]|uniref:DUF2155 domain-containing protein n=1 Tax=Geopsychrobacter electrodiphilus TaxID=225196 RepID=UPI000378F525|nr:DUF2155 domain-containing protein [Geopsychrobacter electrodiphilus]